MQELFRQTVFAMRESVVVTDTQLDGTGPHIVYVNAAFERLTGYSAAEVLGKSPRILQGPRSDRAVLDDLRRSLGEGRGFEGETFNYRKDGTEYLVRWYVFPLPGETGPRFFVGIQRDVTDERRIAGRAWQLGLAVENLDELVLVYDLAGTLHYANRAARRFDALTSTFATLDWLGVSPGTALHDLRWAGVVELEGLALDVSTTRIRNPDGTISVVVVARDTTERHRLERIAAALNTSENLGLVFGSLRHELGNPVNSIRAAIDVLVGRAERDGSTFTTEYLRQIRAEVDRMHGVLEIMRGYSQTSELELRDVDIALLLKRLLERLRPETERRGVEIHVQIASGLHVRADPRAMHQVLLNLVGNAMDALDARSADARGKAEIRIEGKARDHDVALTVADNGIGMSDEQRDRLFRPFQTTKPHGTGLGLLVTQRLLAQMDGSIHVWSRLGEGTVIRLSMRAARE